MSGGDAHSLFEAARRAGAEPGNFAAETWAQRFDALGPWFLDRAVLRLAGAPVDPPEFPTEPGSVAPLFVWDDPGHLLRRVFFFPVRWERGQDDDPRLPQSLLDLAGRAKEALKKHVRSPRIGLRRALGLGGWDFSRCEWKVESAWGALAAGLIAADRNARLDPHVAISAAWSENQGWSPVEHVPEKAGLAREWNLRRFFLPAACKGDAGPDDFFRWLAETTEGRPDLFLQLQPFLYDALDERMKVPENEPLEARCLYANAFPKQQRNEREEYIARHISAELAERLRADAEARHPGFLKVQRVAVLASSSACELTVRLFPEAQMLVLGSYVCRSRTDLRAVPVDKEDLEHIKCEIRGFLDGPGSCAVDLTGGPKSWSVAAALAAPERAWLFQIDAVSQPSHQVGTEKVLVIRRRE